MALLKTKPRRVAPLMKVTLNCMKIRKYEETDLAGVLSCWERASMVGHPFVSQDFLNSEKDNIPKKYLPNGETWVAQKQRAVVGFTILHGNEVGALFVDPKFHGEGVGYALMNKARETTGNLLVEVFKANSVGCNFYFRYGFTLVSEYHHKQTDMVMLRLKFDLSV